MFRKSVINKKSMNKKGQVTVFVIIAVLIIGVVLLFYFLLPKTEIQTTISFDENNPSEYMRMCLEEDIKDSIQLVSLQGGDINPGFHILYQDNKISYACYASDSLNPCVIQRPSLKNHIEKEIKEYLELSVNYCFNKLKENYENKRYNFNLEKKEMKISFLSEKIIFDLNSELTVSKDFSETYKNFEIPIRSSLYPLIIIAESILKDEQEMGDSSPINYMAVYKDLKIEKYLKEDGTNIYILENRINKDKFQFASRSMAYTPGFPEINIFG